MTRTVWERHKSWSEDIICYIKLLHNQGAHIIYHPSWNTIQGTSVIVVQLLSYIWPLQSHGLCSPPGSSVHGVPLARILEWVAISFSRGSSQPRDPTHIFCISRWILKYWATREAPYRELLIHNYIRPTNVNYYWNELGRVQTQSIYGAVGREQVETAFQGNKDTSSADTSGKWNMDQDIRGLWDSMTGIWPTFYFYFLNKLWDKVITWR